MTQYFKPTPRNVLGFLICLALALAGQHLFSKGISHHYTIPFAAAPALTAAGLWLFAGAAWDVRKKGFRKIFKITKARVIESMLYALIFPFFYFGLMPATMLFFLPAHLISITKNPHMPSEFFLIWLLYIGTAIAHFIVLSVFKTKWPGFSWPEHSQRRKRRLATLFFLICATTFSMTFIGLNPFSL